jgi:hydroxyacylglutathione hydrolase
MIVQQFYMNGIAHSSYLLGGTDTCAIVDPRRDVGIYLDAAKQMNMTITHILETHLHADFISGHMELADATGATIYAPKAGNCAFEHEAVAEGDVLEIEDMELRVLETPGHTPEHISYVVTDRARGNDPVGLFCQTSARCIRRMVPARSAAELWARNGRVPSGTSGNTMRPCRSRTGSNSSNR